MTSFSNRPGKGKSYFLFFFNLKPLVYFTNLAASTSLANLGDQNKSTENILKYFFITDSVNACFQPL